MIVPKTTLSGTCGRMVMEDLKYINILQSNIALLLGSGNGTLHDILNEDMVRTKIVRHYLFVDL